MIQVWKSRLLTAGGFFVIPYILLAFPTLWWGNFPIPTARANLEIKMHTMRIEKRHLIYIGVIFKVQWFSILEAYFYLFLILFWGRYGCMILVKYWYQFIIALLSSRSKADWTFVRGRIALGLLSVKFIGNWQSEKFTGGSYDIIELTFCCSFL